MTPGIYLVQDDEKLMLDLLRAEKVLLVQGTGFNWPTPDHFRVVFLPAENELREAITRVGRFLAKMR
jgi:alanine-synthesizing transaminase